MKNIVDTERNSTNVINTIETTEINLHIHGLLYFLSIMRKKHQLSLNVPAIMYFKCCY